MPEELTCCWTPHFLNLKTVTNTLTAVFLCTVRFLIVSAKLWILDSVSSFVSQLKKSRFAIIYIEEARRCWFCIIAICLSQAAHPLLFLLKCHTFVARKSLCRHSNSCQTSSQCLFTWPKRRQSAGSACDVGRLMLCYCIASFVWVAW